MIVKYTKKIILGRVMVSNLRSGNVEMTNLHTVEMAFFAVWRILKNKAIYSSSSENRNLATSKYNLPFYYFLWHELIKSPVVRLFCQYVEVQSKRW